MVFITYRYEFIINSYIFSLVKAFAAGRCGKNQFQKISALYIKPLLQEQLNIYQRQVPAYYRAGPPG